MDGWTDSYVELEADQARAWMNGYGGRVGLAGAGAARSLTATGAASRGVGLNGAGGEWRRTSFSLQTWRPTTFEGKLESPVFRILPDLLETP